MLRTLTLAGQAHEGPFPGWALSSRAQPFPETNVV